MLWPRALVLQRAQEYFFGIFLTFDRISVSGLPPKFVVFFINVLFHFWTFHFILKLRKLYPYWQEFLATLATQVKKTLWSAQQQLR